MLYSLNTMNVDMCYSNHFNNKIYTLGESGNLLSYGQKNWKQYLTPEYSNFTYTSLF
jgi:hypothetical protein